jgi:hypothetical protein
VNQKRFFALTLMLVVSASVSSALAQNSTSPKKDTVKTSAPTDSQASSGDYAELLRKDISSQKKQIIAENMQLSDTEAEKFWPSTIDTRLISPYLRREDCVAEGLCRQLQQHDG